MQIVVYGTPLKVLYTVILLTFAFVVHTRIVVRIRYKGFRNKSMNEKIISFPVFCKYNFFISPSQLPFKNNCPFYFPNITLIADFINILKSHY